MSSKGKATTVDMEGNIYIGPLLKKFRKEVLNVTQERLAIDLGVDQTTVSRWERNNEPVPRYFIKQLMEVYGDKSIPVTKEYRKTEINYYEAAAIN